MEIVKAKAQNAGVARACQNVLPVRGSAGAAERLEKFGGVRGSVSETAESAMSDNPTPLHTSRQPKPASVSAHRLP